MFAFYGDIIVTWLIISFNIELCLHFVNKALTTIPTYFCCGILCFYTFIFHNVQWFFFWNITADVPVIAVQMCDVHMNALCLSLCCALQLVRSWFFVVVVVVVVVVIVVVVFGIFGLVCLFVYSDLHKQHQTVLKARISLFVSS